MVEKKIIIANWKNIKTVADSLAWIDSVGPQLSAFQDYTVIVCPSFVAVEPVSRLIREKGYGLSVGAQSVSRFPSGAYTGEVGAFMLQDYVHYALLGHSERRSNFNESDNDIAEQAARCVEAGIEPIVLVRNEDDLIPSSVRIFGWEPVHAIGSGNAVESDVAAQEIFSLSRNGEMSGIYGGSVNVLNIASFLQHDSIDGVLVGTASYTANHFMELLHALR